MKVFILVCLAALAYAEPDSDSDAFYGLGYSGLYNHGLYNRGLYSPYARTAYTTGYTGYGFPSVYSGYRGFYKRDAEADSDSDSDAFYGLGYSGLYNHGLYNRGLYTPYARTAYTTGYTGYGFPSVYNSGFRHFYKRDAEADADAYWPYTSYAGHHFGYAAAPYYHGYHGYNNHFGLKSYANDAVSPFNYASKGQYAAVNAGAAHFAKRDAEADPLVYTNPLSLSTYAVGSHYRTPFNTYSGVYNHGFYNRGFYNRGLYNGLYY